ncbi:MAG: lipocalin family protein, partial [Bacteroidales bacterium]|nr:lipocalin family protein [Bacteroidales bacterium]
MTGLFSCSTIPKGAEAVKPFDKAKYLGKWFEIARIDFKFERNLNNTTAEYSLNENGTIKVDN